MKVKPLNGINFVLFVDTFNSVNNIPSVHVINHPLNPIWVN